MSDKILIAVMIFCVGFGSYKLISGLCEKAKAVPVQVSAEVSPKETEAFPQETEAVAETNHSPAEDSTEWVEIPVIRQSVPQEKPLPKKISLHELYRLFNVKGIAHGANGSMVVINRTPLYEGETLNGLKVENIRQDHIDVVYDEHSYQLRAKIF